MDATAARSRIAHLVAELNRHDRLYYVDARPEIADAAYDSLYEELRALEAQFPDLVLPDSPTARVGSDLDHALPEAAHTIPVLSLDKAYSADEVRSWLAKTLPDGAGSVVVEEKIDGSSIVLYYEQGVLARAVTRGNGAVGNDVTANVRTIRRIPLVLPETLDLVVRGEIFLPRAAFAAYNREAGDVYANPRNLAAGVLRSVKSASVARVPLAFFAYEGFFSGAERDHLAVLEELARLGFPTNPATGFFAADPALRERAARVHPGWTVGDCAAIDEYLTEMEKRRPELDYEIDGLVCKVNEQALRSELGYTAHHPRWALAFKFESPQAVTRLLAVTVQVGRNGRITPVAELEPVLLAGSTIARATLHNEDYVNQLELALGDSVAISKRGDVIPAVERVVEPNGFGNTTWRFPAQCPSCASLLVKDGAHHFCRNRDCPARRIGVLAHFCGKGGLDIEGLGEKTVELLYEKGFVRVPEELFSFDWQRLVLEDGFGPKKVENIIAGLAACRTRPFRNLLIALGIEALGKRAAELLVENGYDSMEKILADAAAGRWEGFAAIEGFAELTARQLVAGFSDAELRARIGALAAAGLPMAELRAAGESLPQVFAGQRWCVTGSFVNFAPRELAMEEVKKRGGAVVTGVSTKTTHLLAGSGAGSKLAKARELGVIVVDEAAFLVLLDTDGGVQGELPL